MNGRPIAIEWCLAKDQVARPGTGEVSQGCLGRSGKGLTGVGGIQSDAAMDNLRAQKEVSTDS
jgi:hypothetical protein